MNGIHPARGEVRYRVGPEDPGAEQGDRDRDEPPQADRPGDGPQPRSDRGQDGEDAGSPAEERHPHHPAETPDLIFADHAPGWIEFPLEEVKRE